MWQAFHQAGSERGRSIWLGLLLLITSYDCQAATRHCHCGSVAQDETPCFGTALPVLPEFIPPILSIPVLARNSDCPIPESRQTIVFSDAETTDEEITQDDPSWDDGVDDDAVELVVAQTRDIPLGRVIFYPDVSRCGAFSLLKTRPPP